MKEAISKLKRELGADAMIISTRQIRRGLLGKGVEVTAAVDTDDPDPPPPMLSRRPPAPASDVEQFIGPLRSELRQLRTMVRGRSDQRSGESIRRELMAMRSAIAKMREGTAVEAPPLSDVVRASRIVAPSRGRVIALVGPTGVGKTTTIAKLAARAALGEGQSVALVTIDDYRIGAEAQIRIFADLIGVPLTVLSDPRELRSRVAKLQHHDLVFVDTAGRSPRDRGAISTTIDALRDIDDLEVHLTLSGQTPGGAIDAICERYDDLRVDRLLFTKLDETEDLEELVRAPARLRKPITYITTGQRVPEDLEEPTITRLLELATKGAERGLKAA